MDQIAERLEKIVKDHCKVCTFDGKDKAVFQRRLGDYTVCSQTLSTDRNESLMLRSDMRCPHSSPKLIAYGGQVFYCVCKYGS